MRSLWAAGLLLRRIRSERGIILLIFVLVAATSFVFTAAPRLFNRVTDDALRHTAEAALPLLRNLALGLDSSLNPGPGGGVSGVRAYGEKLSQDFPPSVAALISDRQLRFTTVRMYVPDPPSYETHISLRYQDGLTDATRLASGRWPVDRGMPLSQVGVALGPGDADPGAEAAPVVLEAALSTASAEEIGVHLGDRLAITLDGSDPLVRGTPYRIAPTEIEVVGLYEPLDPSADSWKGDPDLLQVSQHGEPDAPVAYVTAYVPAEMYPSLWASRLPFRYEWQFRIDPGRLDADQVAQLQVDLHRLGLITGPTDPSAPGIVRVVTGLPEILDRFAAERALTESVLSIAAIGPFGLAGGAMAMVAILLVTRRRATLALARGRGASGSLVLGTQLWEAILLAGSASLVGLLIAVSVIPARASPLSPVLAVVVGGAAVLLLVGASWPIGQASAWTARTRRVAGAAGCAAPPRHRDDDRVHRGRSDPAPPAAGLDHRPGRERRPLRSDARGSAGAERPGGWDRCRAPLPAAHPRARLDRGAAS